MANVIYQVTPGRIIINSIDLPLDDCVMSYRLDSVLNQYKISIRSSCGNHSWLSDQPLNSIEDNANGTYANITAWKTWWNALDQGASTIVNGSGTPIDFATATKQGDGSQKTQIVDSSGNSLTLSSGEPRYLTCEYTRPSNTTTRPAYGAINETVAVIKELLDPTSKQAANLNGGGGIVINGSIASNNTSDVGRQFGLLFLRDDISPIIADNSVQTILYANQLKRLMVVYTTMEAQASGSDMVIGRFNLPFEYVCKSDSKALKVLIFDVTGGTTASGAKYMVTVNVQVNK